MNLVKGLTGVALHVCQCEYGANISHLQCTWCLVACHPYCHDAGCRYAGLIDNGTLLKLVCFFALLVTHVVSCDIERFGVCLNESYWLLATLTYKGLLQMVEENPANVQESSAEELLGCIQKLQALKSQNKAPAGRTSPRL